ncbi:hypothetical protein [Pantoea stewartii]|uniref:hypothetical protein n=1 Tax=Pantoea stewartii TaxID=66269 RepID=UPI00197D3833|nr:hypothetical protein [Pantoea stewartii]
MNAVSTDMTIARIAPEPVTSVLNIAGRWPHEADYQARFGGFLIKVKDRVNIQPEAEVTSLQSRQRYPA